MPPGPDLPTQLPDLTHTDLNALAQSADPDLLDAVRRLIRRTDGTADCPPRATLQPCRNAHPRRYDP
jgi:hypothetical protein